MSGKKSTSPRKVASTVGTSAPKERPILFSGPMVRAIMEGHKTQTRRILAPQPEVVDTRAIYGVNCYQWGKRQFWPPGVESASKPGTAHPHSWGGWHHLNLCPYGVPGDRLWIKETYFIDHIDYLRGPLPKERPAAHSGGDLIYYRADGECCEQIPECCCAEVGGTKWRSPRFMPRWASRGDLELVNARLQRLQNITEEDAKAEGVESDLDVLARLSHLRGASAAKAVPSRLLTARENFARAWDDINGKRAPWASNPWVWAVTFRRIEGGHG